MTLHQPIFRVGPIAQVGVVGAGLMGTQIATLFAKRLAIPVLLFRLPDADAPTLPGVHTTTNLADLADCDVIIETVTEDLTAKKRVFAELEQVVSPRTGLLTNTSTLSVTEIAANLAQPERVAGLHFFNPVAQMRLVEVVKAPHTSPATIAFVCTMARQLGKTAVVCADRPGFVVNRLLLLVVGQALVAVENGTPVAAADAALAALGLPLTAARLVDLVGPEVFGQALTSLRAQLGPRYPQAPPMSGQGLPLPIGSLGRLGLPVLDSGELAQQLRVALQEEMQLMLAEEVVTSEAQIELCLRLGAGWRLPN